MFNSCSREIDIPEEIGHWKHEAIIYNKGYLAKES